MTFIIRIFMFMAHELAYVYYKEIECRRLPKQT